MEQVYFKLPKYC